MVGAPLPAYFIVDGRVRYVCTVGGRDDGNTFVPSVPVSGPGISACEIGQGSGLARFGSWAWQWHGSGMAWQWHGSGMAVVWQWHGSGMAVGLVLAVAWQWHGFLSLHEQHPCSSTFNTVVPLRPLSESVPVQEGTRACEK